MGNSLNVQTAFFHGEWSPYMQGRFDDPRYKTALAACFNALPIETGAWTRRPGTQAGQGGYTRGGKPARVIAFDLASNQPYNMEFSAGFLRFWTGTTLATTNDAQSIVAISAANPAVVQTALAHGWTTGNTGFFSGLGVNDPLLQNRLFTLTVVDATHVSIADAITGATINGSTLGAFVAGSIARVQELVTPYVGSSWSTLRSVQAEEKAVLLNPGVAPQLLSVTTEPSSTTSLPTVAQFKLNPLVFKDGPYLDPVSSGATLAPGGAAGSIVLTVSYQAWSSTVAYNIGDYVVASSVSYVSLIAPNVGNTPASSPGAWQVTTPDAFVQQGGFQAADVGRHIRLLSEPANWNAATAYTFAAGTVGPFVTYNGSAWAALASSTGVVPGSNATSWGPAPQQISWSWGVITGAATLISGTLAGSAYFGDLGAVIPLLASGPLANAFNGTIAQTSLTAPGAQIGPNGPPPGASFSFNHYLGQNFSGASPQSVGTAVVYPSTDSGFFFNVSSASITANLYASNSLPGSPTAGTLLGSTTVSTLATAISVSSNNQSATWNYIWVQLTGNFVYQGLLPAVAVLYVAQCQFYKPNAFGGASSTITVALYGPALPQTTPIETWRLGAFSGRTGWPTCGTYHEGRIWLNDPLGNIINGSVSNAAVEMDVNGLSFAPTNYDGSVSDQNGVRYVLNAPDNNIIYWMQPDLQGLIIGTQGGEWLVQATTLNAPLTATSVQAHRVTRVRCANIEPRRTELTTVFVQAQQRKVIEYFADVFSGKFTAPNLSETAKHLTTSGLEELAYQQELMPTIWARTGNGQLIGAAYKRDTLFSSQGPKFCGWHRHALGSGFSVQSITVGPDVTGDLEALTMVTLDAAGLYHVEIMTGMADEAVSLATAWQVDCAVTPSSQVLIAAPLPPAAPYYYGAVTFNGLWHLNGYTVSVWAAGLDCGDFVVANGSVTVPFGDGIGAGTASGLFTAAALAATPNVAIGFNYTSQGQMLPPVDPKETGAQAGVAFAKKQRAQKFGIKVANAGPGGISVGGTFSTLLPVVFKQKDGMTPIPLTQMYTGIHHDTINEDYTRQMMDCWQVGRPYPMTLTAWGEFLHTQDE